MSTAADATPTGDPLRNRRGLVEGVLLGATYGVLLRGASALSHHFDQQLRTTATNPLQQMTHFQGVLHQRMLLGYAGMTMTVAFLVLGPIVIGSLTVSRLEARSPASPWTWIVAPWLAVLLMMSVVALFAWEGAICVVMALPIALLFASVGGLIAGLSARRNAFTATQLSSVALLPFLLAPAESLLPAPTQTRTVNSQLLIHAPSAAVWRNIERVPAIIPAELRPTWTHRIGFPRPLEATLSFEGVGGIRHASFEHGLLFIETVTAWEPDHRLAFRIQADTEHIPPTTLDPHVTIGGRYFDVLDGEYRLEPLANGDTLLHLTSHQRLSTDFNGYAGIWSDAVMQTLQTSILEVIQHRCEATHS